MDVEGLDTFSAYDAAPALDDGEPLGLGMSLDEAIAELEHVVSADAKETEAIRVAHAAEVSYHCRPKIQRRPKIHFSESILHFC